MLRPYIHVSKTFMPKTAVHIINHTHWDREWFLSSVYTTQWIPGLIDTLEKLGAANPEFRYFFDGQTLVIEDLLLAYPEYEEKVARLIAAGTLTIGPYYCQPDWKLTCGESLVRNLAYGQKDGARFGKTADIGWLVDTFGHISQVPQIHEQGGIDTVFVWRGMPLLEPYFEWEGADGTKVFGVDLFGGYRNLYGVTHAPEVAITRLQSEVDKLSPFYPTPDIPVFDGYDLEDDPEDPVRFFSEQLAVNSEQWAVHEATPRSFVETVRPKLGELPKIVGELNSGKYGAIFTGVYSARTYTKVLNRDCSYQLYQVAEPLGVLASLKGRDYQAAQYEQWSRLLLQNGVHDVICGVSIDQVHEKMVDIYRRVFDGTQADIQQSLEVILQDFAPGTYAISTSPFAQEAAMEAGNQLFWVETNGIGVWQISDGMAFAPQRYEAKEGFAFSNDFYAVELNEDGTLQLEDGRLGSLQVYAEHGDSYSDEMGQLLGVLQPSGPLEYETRGHETVVHYDCRFEHEGIVVETAVRIILDSNPLIRWEVDLDSRGVDFRVELVFETGLTDQVWAGMPFDVVKRPFADTDLLPREVEGMAKIFMGQRELNEVRSFPFHDFVAITDDGKTAVVFAKGINSYRAYENGRLSIALRRSVEWVTKGNLENRIGDAGPFFYVPDGRCERLVRHELAFAVGDFAPNSMELQKLNAAYQNPPLIVEWNGDGTETSWGLLQADMPLSSLQVVEGQIQARWFNPTNKVGDAIDDVIGVKEIVATTVPAAQSGSKSEKADGTVMLLNLASWRVGENQGLPDPKEIAKLKEKIAKLEVAVEEARTAVTATQDAAADGENPHILQHRVYIHHREMLEYKLSAYLNETKLAMNGDVSEQYLYEPDETVVQIGWELNQLRIKRRIYDYVAAALT